MEPRRASSVVVASVFVGLLTLVAGGERSGRRAAGMWSGTPGAPIVDATPYNYAKQDYTLCAVQCFATLYRQGTVPYISMDQPRNVTLVYNSHRAKPRPSVLVNVSPDLSFGQTPTQYQLQVKVNGAVMTFVNGEQTLHFTYPGAAPARIGGALNVVSYATGVYPMDILVSALYPGGSLITTDVVTKLVVVNEKPSAIAAGWTLGGIQHLYLQSDSTALFTEGDGSAVYFAHSPGVYTAPSGEFSKLILSPLSGSNGWARVYADSTKAVFDNTGKMVQLRDRFNNITAITYDASSRVVKVTDPMNLADTLIYGANGLASIKDPGGRITNVSVENGTLRRLLAITDPDNVSTNFVTDTSLLLWKVADRRGDTTKYGYDTLSANLCCLTFPPVPIVNHGTVSPTESHYPWQEVGVPTGPTAVTPWPTPLADTVRARIIDARGYETALRVDRFGAVTQETDPVGRVTKIVRDTNALIVKDSFPSGGIDSIAYNSSGLPTFMQPAALSAINLRYAGYGQADSIWGTGRLTLRNYIGANGRVDSTRIGGFTVTRMRYDIHGRPDSIVDGERNLVRRSWFAGINGNLSKDSLPGGRVTTHLYDAYGRDTAVQSPQTALRRTHYDLLNRATQVYDGVNANPANVAYDSLFVRSVTDPKSQVYGFTFNALGWVTQRTDPAGRVDQYLYDAVGDLCKWINRRGDTLTYSYDGLRRRTNKDGRNASSESWTYSTSGLVITTTSPADTETAYFSVFGQPDSVRTAFAGLTGQVYWRRYRYTTAGLVDSVDITGGGISFRSRKYVYNTDLGTLTAIRLGGVSSNLLTDANLQDTSVAFPGGDRLSQQYYPLHSTTQLSTSAAYNPTIARSMGFDSLGRIKLQVVGNGANGNRYTYDGLGRLLSDSSVNNPAPPASCSGNPPPAIDAYGNSCVNAGGWAAVSGVQFAYDAAGNRTDNGGTYGTGDRISAFGGCTYGTDNDGNVTSRTCGTETLSAAWTAESRLITVTIGTQTVGFHYDALGRLVRKTLNGTPQSYFLWDRFNLLAELASSGTAAVDEYSYYPALDDLHAIIVGGVQYNAHKDGFDNVIALTDGVGTVQRMYQYDAWGQLTGGSDIRPFNGVDRARWKGALWLGPEIDLYYMRNRWYEPRTSRFLSEDPLVLATVAPPPQSRFACTCTDLFTELAKGGTSQPDVVPAHPWPFQAISPEAYPPPYASDQTGGMVTSEEPGSPGLPPGMIPPPSGVVTQLTCYGQTDDPHFSTHAPGMINVVGRTWCDQPAPYMLVHTTLKRRKCFLFICWWSSVGPPGIYGASGVRMVQASSAASCRNGWVYKGFSFHSVTFPTGGVGETVTESVGLRFYCGWSIF